MSVAAHSLALKSNGEIWTWGNGVAGRLGDNNTVTHKSSPVLVVGSGYFHLFTELMDSSTEVTPTVIVIRNNVIIRKNTTIRAIE